MGPEKKDRLLPVNVVADQLGVSRDTIYRWIRGGLMPALNPGVRQTRVSRRTLAAFKAASGNTPELYFE